MSSVVKFVLVLLMLGCEDTKGRNTNDEDLWKIHFKNNLIVPNVIKYPPLFELQIRLTVNGTNTTYRTGDLLSNEAISKWSLGTQTTRPQLIFPQKRNRYYTILLIEALHWRYDSKDNPVKRIC